MSRDTPEKNELSVGISWMAVVTPPEVCTGVPVTLVTKNWSVPTFRTAFWLLRAATRGLDKTWTFPCDSRNWSKAAKLLVWTARPNTPAPTAPAADTAVAAHPVPPTPVVPGRPLGLALIWLPVDRLPVGPRWGFEPITPPPARALR